VQLIMDEPNYARPVFRVSANRQKVNANAFVPDVTHLALHVGSDNA